MRVLIVDDETAVREAISRALRMEGHDIRTAPNGAAGLEALGAEPIDVVVLDVQMPLVDGLEMCRRMRALGDRTPVLMLTARSTVGDRVAGLDAGADDYLVKPFAFPELLARVRALVRRSRGDQLLRLAISDLVMDVADRKVTRGGQPIDLTPREFDLLAYLVRNKGVIVSREMVARDVWEEPVRGTPLDNVIDVHIARLRRKIDREGASPLIHTIRGVGFIVRESEA